MAFTNSDTLKVEKPNGTKAKITAVDIFGILPDTSVKSKYEDNPNTNAFTDSEKAKLAALDPNHYRGTFLTLTALQAIAGTSGDYGDVDAGAGEEVARYIWDADDSSWVAQSGVVGSETDATIKAKYENNPNTNAYVDDDKTKVDNITVSTAVNLDTLKATVETNSTARHDAFTLANDTGFSLNGQQLGNSYSTLPPA